MTMMTAGIIGLVVFIPWFFSEFFGHPNRGEFVAGAIALLMGSGFTFLAMFVYKSW